MERPLVSVICLCFNQADYVVEAIESVLHQTYQPIEIIVVDDASTDKSASIIRDFCKRHPSVKSLLLETNVGNCKAFNQGLAIAQGEFIIDLAADDILLPERVEYGVASFMKNGNEFGVHYCDAEGIDETGKHLWFHSKKIGMKHMPEGDLYEQLITRYFVCSPTVMCRKMVFDSLGGYDESLAFEDFDFWMRSSRLYKYCYSDKVLVKKRILPNSKSDQQYRRGSDQMRSIFSICNKILRMNKVESEMRALKTRVYYEMKMAASTGNVKLMFEYVRLIRKINRYINRRIFPSESPLRLA